MLPVLRFIADGIALIGQMVLWAIVTALNLLIAAVGGLIALVLSLLPQLPAPLDLSGSGILTFFAWLMPLGAMAAWIAVLVTAYAVFAVVRIALNWAKAL